MTKLLLGLGVISFCVWVWHKLRPSPCEFRNPKTGEWERVTNPNQLDEFTPWNT